MNLSTFKYCRLQQELQAAKNNYDNHPSDENKLRVDDIQKQIYDHKLKQKLSDGFSYETRVDKNEPL